MVFALFKKPDPIPPAIYDQIVEQARSVLFFTHFGVPDTLNGRYEMVALHVALVCRRMRSDNESVAALSQDVFDTFITEMDRTYREMGIGDTTVPKKMKTLGEIFYGRAKTLDECIDGEAGLLAGVYERNVVERPEDAAKLEAYAIAADKHLKTIDDVAILNGEVSFPKPGDVL
ncbi:MAG: ubiquinol-cytochrome C chaperone family protein [Pseudomonadota bacterium]